MSQGGGNRGENRDEAFFLDVSDPRKFDYQRTPFPSPLGGSSPIFGGSVSSRSPHLGGEESN